VQTSQNGIDLIKRFEGLELESYQDIAGIWTIGYGHTGPEVGPDQQITASEAEALLRHDLISREKGVNRLVRVPLNQNEFDALVSFVYNVGLGAFERSTCRRRLNNGNRVGAAEALTWFNKATVNGVLVEVRGLTIRRAAEKALFLTPVADFTSQPEDLQENARVTPMEDPPRRGGLGDSRTIQGATVAGGAGVAASNMGRETAEELDEVEREIEQGTAGQIRDVDVEPMQDDTPMASDGEGDGVTPMNGDDRPDDTDVPDLEGGPDTQDGGDLEDGPGAADDTQAPDTDPGGTDAGGDATEDPGETPSSDTGTMTQQPENPAAHANHDSEAQIQLALMLIIIVAILYVIYARIDDWWNHRR